MVDAESVSTRLDRLSQLLRELEEIQAVGHDAYKSDFCSLDGKVVWRSLDCLDDLRQSAAFAQNQIC